MDISKIYKSAKPKKPSIERKVSDTFVLQMSLVKKITPLLAQFEKTNISADLITIVSYLSIILSSTFFLINVSYLGIIFLFLFGLLDSFLMVIKRIKKVKTNHGETMDIFGADLFYFLIPFSISFFI